MSHVVIQLPKNQLANMQSFYEKERLNKNVPYTQFIAKKNGTTITAYTSGKVLFQGSQAEAEASRWQNLDRTSDERKAKPTSALPKDLASQSWVGSDEVGNGSYFGPLIVCAVYASAANLPQLKKLGVKDSKMLTDHDIRALAPKIKEIVPYRLLEVTPTKYNEIQPKYNAVHMKVALHNQAIQLLLKQIAPEKPEGILIDQFTPEGNYRKYLKGEKTPVTDKLYFVTQGEQYHLAVAAASILCRAQFLESLQSASKKVGHLLPSGAGAKSDQVAAKLLREGGMALLAQHAKLHFANTKKAQKLMEGAI
ncbi:ribonuclease HIII [Enterococcus sp. LJL98]